ncbi:MAG: RNA polymerase subunit sigma-70 [Planctomycetes bacterium RBG_16_43_13]|nr:MAG: RNA polymerase subunit sigma-70 [Planctomycetes bacterium RBG_16_43_13]
MKRTKEDIQKIWVEFSKTSSRELKNLLIEEYLPIVRYVAERMSERLPKSVQVDDLVSTGVFGLLDAIDRFDIKRGVKFETYCIGRVRGAMLDELRAMDWVPRLTRARANKLEGAYIKLEKEHNRAPTDIELAKELQISLKALDELMLEVSAASLLSVQRKGLDKDDNKLGGTVDVMEDRKVENPRLESEKKDLIDYVKKNLSTKERYILMMYYFDELTLKEIGRVLGLSESRVCQLHSKLVSKLRAQLKKKKTEVV